MLLSQARAASFPPCLPLEQAPLWPMPLDSGPPRIAWIGVGRHGRWAREDYRVPGNWCVHLYRWSGALEVAREGGRVALPVRPGYTSVVPPDTPLSHFFPAGAGAPALHLSSGFALGGETGTSAAAAPPLAPMMQDLGADFDRLAHLFEEAVGFFGAQPRRAEARLWDLLWEIAERVKAPPPPADGESPLVSGGRAGGSGEHPAVVRARELIELRLGEPELRVADLAAAVDLSHNHLTRLFHAATGQTVVGYLRGRRIARARRLLLHTTLPIKAVAAQVGIPDLHRFNKAVRSAEGRPPRVVRAGAGVPP